MICPGAHLTVLGELRSHSALDSIEQEVGRIIVGWKQDQAARLAKFDRNHDGQLDADEWQAARAAAREQGEASLGSRNARLSVVGQTTHGEPFLIAPLDTKNLVRREKHRAALALAASVLLALLTAWAAQESSAAMTGMAPATWMCPAAAGGRAGVLQQGQRSEMRGPVALPPWTVSGPALAASKNHASCPKQRWPGREPRSGAYPKSHFGCGVSRRYGRNAFQPAGNFDFASESGMDVGMMTSSPRFQLTGVATLCFAFN